MIVAVTWILPETCASRVSATAHYILGLWNYAILEIERTYMFQLKTPDMFTLIQWYAFQVAVVVIFLATLVKFVRWVLR
jgi:hypothetical protein